MRGLVLSLVIMGCGSAAPQHVDDEHRGGMNPASMTPSEALCAHSRPVVRGDEVTDYRPALAARGFSFAPVHDLLDCSGAFEQCHTRTFVFRQPSSNAQLVGITSVSGRRLVPADTTGCTTMTSSRTLAAEDQPVVIAERVLGGCTSGGVRTHWLIVHDALGRPIGELVCEGQGTFDVATMRMTCGKDSFTIDIDQLPYCHGE